MLLHWLVLQIFLYLEDVISIEQYGHLYAPRDTAYVLFMKELTHTTIMPSLQENLCQEL